MTKKTYKLTIPKPCHQSWEVMTPAEKGRFCDTCSKTVIDFTNKSNEEVKSYLIKNIGNRVCGRFKRSQLDSIVLQIPNNTFQYDLSFQKIFMLALLLAMGTVLFSCKSEGKTQKIDKVEVIDSITKEVVDTLIIKQTCTKDTLVPPPTLLISTPPLEPEGLPGLNVVGNLSPPPLDEETGEAEIVEYDYEEPINFIEATIPPKFKNTDKGTREELRNIFRENINNFVSSNFDKSFYSDLNLDKGNKRIFVKFIITEDGVTEDIMVKAAHPKLKERVTTLFQKLPKFTPGKLEEITVDVNYIVPINFTVD